MDDMDAKVGLSNLLPILQRTYLKHCQRDLQLPLSRTPGSEHLAMMASLMFQRLRGWRLVCDMTSNDSCPLRPSTFIATADQMWFQVAALLRCWRLLHSIPRLWDALCAAMREGEPDYTLCLGTLNIWDSGYGSGVCGGNGPVSDPSRPDLLLHTELPWVVNSRSFWTAWEDALSIGRIHNYPDALEPYDDYAHMPAIFVLEFLLGVDYFEGPYGSHRHLRLFRNRLHSPRIARVCVPMFDAVTGTMTLTRQLAVIFKFRF